MARLAQMLGYWWQWCSGLVGEIFFYDGVMFQSCGRAIFDGHSTHIIQAGGSLLVEPAVYPLPMINLRRYDRDWFHGLTDKLLWNKSQLPRASPVG